MKTPTSVGILTIALFTAGCGEGALNNLKLPPVLTVSSAGLSVQDPGVVKLTPDSSIPILLMSNKQNTRFSVNGHDLEEAKLLKVLVPREPITITAQAPCYHTLQQRAEANGFSTMSQFEFTFGKWDRDPKSRDRNCT